MTREIRCLTKYLLQKLGVHVIVTKARPWILSLEVPPPLRLLSINPFPTTGGLVTTGGRPFFLGRPSLPFHCYADDRLNDIIAVR